jgi:hypothetical protein
MISILLIILTLLGVYYIFHNGIVASNPNTEYRVVKSNKEWCYFVEYKWLGRWFILRDIGGDCNLPEEFRSVEDARAFIRKRQTPETLSVVK